MKTLLKYLALAALAAGLTAGLAHATPTLYITDGIAGHTVTIADGSIIPGAVDVNPVSGAVSWIGDVGLWTLNVDTGSTKPAIGSATNPKMDIIFAAQSPAASLDASGQPVESILSIFFSESGFTASGNVADHIGGTMNGSGLNVWDYVIKNWNLPDVVPNITAMGPITGDSFSRSGGGEFVSLGVADVFTVGVVLNSIGDKVYVTGDKFVTLPDGGTTALLLGLGLLGMGLIRRSKKS